MSIPIWFFSSHSWLWSRTNLWSPQPCLLRGNQLTRLRKTVPKYLQKFRHSLCSYHFVVLHCTDQALSSEASDHSRWPQYTPGKLQGSPECCWNMVAKCDPWIHRATQGPTIDADMGKSTGPWSSTVPVLLSSKKFVWSTSMGTLMLKKLY